MSKHARDNRPYLPPVTKIELSEKNIKLRWILIVVLMAIAVVAIFTGLTELLNTEPGWQTVEVSARETNCGGDFILQYDFTDSGAGTNLKFKELTEAYSDAAVRGYKLFSAQLVEEGLKNVGYVNAHVNETVTVEEELFQALSLAAEYDSRQIFTAPAMAEYNRVFLCETEAEAQGYIPWRDSETVAYLAQLGSFVSDPDHIRLEVKGENRVQLSVSQEYLDFAREQEIGTFLDFGWMKNAFLADYLAEVLTEKGFTTGYLTSFDGYTRNLDLRGSEYSLNLFDRKQSGIYLPASMNYSGPLAIVSLRSYPMGEQDRWRAFAFESGEVVSVYLNPETCLTRTAAENLVSYGSAGCGEILMRTAPIFTGETLSADHLNALTREGIYSIWFDGWNLCHNDPDLSLTENAEGGAGQYRVNAVIFE